MSKILALDYGAAKIGVAISDEGQSMVFGRGFLERKDGIFNCFEKILQLCKTEKIAIIVAGLPLNEEGHDTVQSKKIRNFVRKLEHFLKKHSISAQIFFEDESFSSFEASEHLAGLGFKVKKSKKYEDELAAILILQKYLKLKK